MTKLYFNVEFTSFLTVADPRWAQAGCEFTCISCCQRIVYSSVETGSEEEKCSNCGKVYIIESFVENETYAADFDPETDGEFIEVVSVTTEASNARRYIEED